MAGSSAQQAHLQPLQQIRDAVRCDDVYPRQERDLCWLSSVLLREARHGHLLDALGTAGSNLVSDAVELQAKPLVGCCMTVKQQS
jgi:hypothetical protein